MGADGRIPGGGTALVHGHSLDVGQPRILLGYKSQIEQIGTDVRTPSGSCKTVFHHPIEDDPCLHEAFVHRHEIG